MNNGWLLPAWGCLLEKDWDTLPCQPHPLDKDAEVAPILCQTWSSVFDTSNPMSLSQSLRVSFSYICHPGYCCSWALTWKSRSGAPTPVLPCSTQSQARGGHHPSHTPVLSPSLFDDLVPTSHLSLQCLSGSSLSRFWVQQPLWTLPSDRAWAAL